jgi:pyruvate formate lyase activating enzyme
LRPLWLVYRRLSGGCALVGRRHAGAGRLPLHALRCMRRRVLRGGAPDARSHDGRRRRAGGGIHTALDTSGYAPWNVVDAIRNDVDLFLYDLKHVDDERHRQFTGVSNALILDNLTRLAEHGHRIVLRLPLVPGVNDDDPTIRAIGALAARLGIERVVPLPFHRLGSDKYGRLGRAYDLHDTVTPPTDRVAAVLDVLRESGVAAEQAG